MMKTRGIFYFVFLVLILSLSGIQGCPTKDEEKGEEELGAYIGGTDGLGISFVEEEPPETVLDNNQDPFYITLLVENNGEYSIPAGKIIATISGISKDAFGMSSLNAKSKSELFGKTKFGNEVIEGGVDNLQFDQANYKHDLSADFSTQLRADVCYNYQTKSLVKLCLKKNPVQRKQEDICLVTNENVDAENSGAPLQISGINSRGSSDSVTFTFTVENKGTGEAYENNAFTDSCMVKSDKQDKVNVKVVSESGKLAIKCGVLENKDYGIIRLVDNRKTISCSFKTSALQDTAFEEPFEITLDYFYKGAIGKDLIVINSEY